MRLPGSLHGGTSLKVTEIPRGNLTEFNPLTDAIPDFFTGESVDVSMNSAVEIDVGVCLLTRMQGTSTNSLNRSRCF